MCEVSTLCLIRRLVCFKNLILLIQYLFFKVLHGGFLFLIKHLLLISSFMASRHNVAPTVSWGNIPRFSYLIAYSPLGKVPSILKRCAL